MKILQALGAVLLAAVVTGVTVLALAGKLMVCEQRLATVGIRPVVDVCRAVSLTDVPVLLVVVALLLLFMQGVTRISIPGLVELERKVADQAETQSTLENEVAALRLSMVQSQRAVQIVYGGAPPTDTQIEHVAAGLGLKEEVFRGATGGE